MTLNNKYKYLNLLHIKLPIPGIVSIAHRVSGVLMFVAIPLVAYLLDQSVSSAESYQEVSLLLAHPVIKFALIVIGWSLFHHLFAGIRYLLIDIDIGVELAYARFSAWLVMATAIAATLFIVWMVV